MFNYISSFTFICISRLTDKAKFTSFYFQLSSAMLTTLFANADNIKIHYSEPYYDGILKRVCIIGPRHHQRITTVRMLPLKSEAILDKNSSRTTQ